MPSVPLPLRSKSVAAWLALAFGAIGLHRLYLYGLHDRWAWLHPLPTLLGLLGVQRLMQLGQDDHLAWALIPLLGLMISQGMLAAIVYGLTSDEKWAERHNPGQSVVATTWAPVLAAIAALFVGGAVLVGTIAYGGQMFFQWQLEDAAGAARR